MPNRRENSASPRGGTSLAGRPDRSSQPSSNSRVAREAVEGSCQVRATFAPVETGPSKEAPFRPGTVEVNTETPPERLSRFRQQTVAA